MAMGGMFTSSITPYHLDAQQWLPADEVMQEEASKPLELRLLPSQVVSHTRKHCFVGAVKTPSHNAVKRRYQIYFLGPLEIDGSVVEKADRKMEFAATSLDAIFTKPSEVAEEIKNTHFNASPSELHTSEAIEKRYRTLFLKWVEADKSMKDAARTRYGDNRTFSIGAIVQYVKNNFFPNDPSTTTNHIQDRYCKVWLGIKNTPGIVGSYDQELINKAMSTLPLLPEEPTTSQSVNHLNVSTRGFAANAHGSNTRPFESAMPLRQQPIVGGISQEIQTTAPPTLPPWLSSDHYPSATSRPHSQKRARPNSFDSNSSASTLHHSSPSTYFNFTQPPLEKVQQKLRDSGFVSSTSTSDTSSLLSRMSRLSIEVKLCTADHTLLDPGHSCNFCRYPEVQPKPLVYLAPEYVGPLQADLVDADIDNRIMTTNADAIT